MWSRSQAPVNPGAAQGNTNRNTSAASLCSFTVHHSPSCYSGLCSISTSHSSPQGPCGGPQEALAHGGACNMASHWSPWGSEIASNNFPWSICHWALQEQEPGMQSPVLSSRMDFISLFNINPDIFPDAWKHKHQAQSFSQNLGAYHTVFVHSPA